MQDLGLWGLCIAKTSEVFFEVVKIVLRTFRDLDGAVTHGKLGIEDLAKLTTVAARCLATDADVEVLAVIWVRIPGVGYCNAVWHSWTGEVYHVFRVTVVCALCFIWPDAGATLE